MTGVREIPAAVDASERLRSAGRDVVLGTGSSAASPPTATSAPSGTPAAASTSSPRAPPSRRTVVDAAGREAADVTSGSRSTPPSP
ncbi:hypothetical protein KCH_10970 [Kitasatospora cheerisanensis KCTC 2395]|uniref:Uncharacterized protein n=1 Tax=Kitasatospora cheerisanensis KCTC 2395 TaxID=1348663 RepID=A0A066Z0H8_9ACTN|nr:hypothetical protein KCH_10970 [Kitasatospora cheerisanensis KCTC 2395]